MTAIARPYEELLAALADAGLAVGAAEHLAVARLATALAGSQHYTARAALAAVLAHDEAGVRLVKETFDRLYLPAPPPPPIEPARPPPAARWIWRVITALPLLALLAWLSLERRLPDAAEPTPWDPTTLDQSPPVALDDGLSKPDEPPPRIDAEPVGLRWEWITAIVAGAALLALLPLLTRRLRRRAAEEALERELLERPALPGPFGYELRPRPPRGFWERALLDDVAFALGRRVDPHATGNDIDVGRTVERSLRTVPVPYLVFMPRRAPPPLLVLEDIGEETRLWRPWVDGLLDGLAARGVQMDRWRFHGDGSRVFRSVGAPTRTLFELHRRRTDSPLLVVSAGEGVPQRAGRRRTAAVGGRPGTAPWTALLAGWNDRAWLHPVPDRGYWRPPLDTWPEVLPLDAAGLAAAVERLVPGRGLRSQRRREPPTRWRDVELLRWLLALAPQANAEVAEALRRRYLLAAPRSVLLEALTTAQPSERPATAPADDDVRELLSKLLADEPPPAGSEAHERWQLDQALLEAQLTDEARWRPAAERLSKMAEGPLGSETRRAVRRVAQDPATRRPGDGAASAMQPAAAKVLRRQVLEPPLRRTLGAAPTRHSWRRTFSAPSWREALAWAGLTAVTAAGVIWMAEPRLAKPATIVKDLQLTLSEEDRGEGGGQLRFVAPTRTTEPIFILSSSGHAIGTILVSSGLSVVPFRSEDRDTWAYARDRGVRPDGTLHASNALWIRRRLSEGPRFPEPLVEVTPIAEATPAFEDSTATATPLPAENAPAPAGFLRIVEYPQDLPFDHVLAMKLETSSFVALQRTRTSLPVGTYDIVLVAAPVAATPRVPLQRLGEIVIREKRTTVFKFPAAAVPTLRATFERQNPTPVGAQAAFGYLAIDTDLPITPLFVRGLTLSEGRSIDRGTTLQLPVGKYRLSARFSLDLGTGAPHGESTWVEVGEVEIRAGLVTTFGPPYDSVATAAFARAREAAEIGVLVAPELRPTPAAPTPEPTPEATVAPIESPLDTSDEFLRKNVAARCTKVIVEQLGVEPTEVVPNASLRKDLSADELDIVELVIALEEEFGVAFMDDEVATMSSVQDVINVVWKAFVRAGSIIAD